MNTPQSMPSDPYNSPGGGQYGAAEWQNPQQSQYGYPGQGQYQEQHPGQQYPQQGGYPGGPAPTSGYPGAAPNPGYPGPAPTSGYPGPAPTSGYPGAAPNPGYPGPAPTPGYPGPVPTSGYPGQAPTSGYPGAAPTSGYPGPAPTSGYPGPAPVSGYPGGPPGPGYPGAEAYLGGPMPPPQRKSRKGVITAVVAGVVTLLLVGGVGAWAAAKRWFDSGDQPETAMPASVSLYARLDMDPSLDQTVKLFNLARKFPAVDKSAGGSLGDVEKKVFDSLDLKGMTYDADVKPWFGHKVGVGLWTDKQSKPFVLVALACTDDGKASSMLKKAKALDDEGAFGYSVGDGYALLAMGEKNAQAAADEAASEAKDDNLDGSSAFSKTLGKLPKGQVAIGWADFDLLRKHQKSLSSVADINDLVRGGIPEELSGHAMVAAQAGGSGFELRMRMSGLSSAPKSDQDALPALGKMPGNTLVALGYSGASGQKSLPDISGLGGLARLSELDDSADAEGIINAIFQAKLVTVALTGMKSGDPLMSFGVDARTSDDAATISKTLKEFASENNAKLKTNGTAIELTTPGYSSSGAALSEQQLYRDAMSGMPTHCGFAGYVNIKGLLDATDADADDREELGPLKAIGAGVGVDGGDLSMLVRAVL